MKGFAAKTLCSSFAMIGSVVRALRQNRRFLLVILIGGVTFEFFCWRFIGSEMYRFDLFGFITEGSWVLLNALIINRLFRPQRWPQVLIMGVVLPYISFVTSIFLAFAPLLHFVFRLG